MPFTQAQEQLAQTGFTQGAQPGKPAQDELLSRASHAFNEIARNAMPAVVSVSTIRRAPSPHAGLLPPDLQGVPGLRDPGVAKPPGGMTDPRMMGIGSGSIIRKDGLILTNYHVVEEAERITVLFDDKHRYKAHVVGTDPKTDLALIQIDPKDKTKRDDYPTIAFGDSEQIREGDWAIAIGSPFGLNRSVSFGIVSAKGRGQMGFLDVEDFIQTDAAINPGSSGGPLLNSRGELIGVNTAIFSQGGGNMGIGFAVPAKIAHEISDQLITQGRVSRGWMGLMAQDLDQDLARFFGVPGAGKTDDSEKIVPGALVSQVLPSGPAGLASLKSGDVITRYDNHAIEDASTLKALVGKSKAGSKIPMEVIREGKTKSLTVAIQEQPQPPSELNRGQQAGQAGAGKAPHMPSLGLAVEDIPKELANLLHLSPREGTIVVGVNPGSPAFDAGIGPGDIILSANRTPVRGAKDFTRMAKKLSDDQDIAVLFVQRGPVEKVFIPLRLKDEA
jgi:serine protease Do